MVSLRSNCTVKTRSHRFVAAAVALNGNRHGLTVNHLFDLRTSGRVTQNQDNLTRGKFLTSKHRPG